MTTIKLTEIASTTTYDVSLEQVTLMVAINLGVPPQAVHVRYNIVSEPWDGPGCPPQRVDGLIVTVDQTQVRKHSSNC